jgi:hypothetical protein
MREVVLQIPTFEAEQNIDIDVKINGKRKPCITVSRLSNGRKMRKRPKKGSTF